MDEKTLDPQEETLAEEAKTEPEVSKVEVENSENGVEASAETDAEVNEEVSLEDKIADLEAQLSTAQAESAKHLDAWQRVAADMANYKRRQEANASRQREDITSSIISQILPVLDDLDLAFQHIPDSLSEQESSWVEGFQLVQRKLLKILENNKVEVIDSKGEFDPNLHEAVTYEASPDHESNTIIAELRKGYQINKRIIRPALVRVAQ